MSSKDESNVVKDSGLELNSFENVVAVSAPQTLQKDISSQYRSKKSAAEGMMDLSLLTASANQLKFILFYNQESKTFYVALILIVFSLVLQITVGVLLIFRVIFVVFLW